MPVIVRYMIAGTAAGTITGILGSGGGLILVPLLFLLCHSENVFSVSLAVMLPTCIVSLLFLGVQTPLSDALPYLIGGSVGGLLAVPLSEHIPTILLHKFFGIIMLWGGYRFLVN